MSADIGLWYTEDPYLFMALDARIFQTKQQLNKPQEKKKQDDHLA